MGYDGEAQGDESVDGGVFGEVRVCWLLWIIMIHMKFPFGLGGAECNVILSYSELENNFNASVLIRCCLCLTYVLSNINYISSSENSVVQY